MRRWTTIAVVAACLTLAGAATKAKAAEIVLVTTNAVEQILRDLIPAFQRETGHTVSMNVYGTGLAVSKLKEGASADLVLLSPEALGDLAKAGKVSAGTITDVFRSRIGLAVRAGAPKPDIGSDDALKKTLLDATSIGYSIGPSGEYFSNKLIQRLGIADAIKSKIMVVRPGPVGDGVARGDVQIGIHQVAELMQVKGIDIVGPIPADLQTTIIYATGIAGMARQPDAAKALAKFLTGEAAAPAIRKNGMNPA